jgi:hypothetical protein
MESAVITGIASCNSLNRKRKDCSDDVLLLKSVVKSIAPQDEECKTFLDRKKMPEKPTAQEKR